MHDNPHYIVNRNSEQKACGIKPTINLQESFCINFTIHDNAHYIVNGKFDQNLMRIMVCFHVLIFATLSLSQLQDAVDKTRRLGARPPWQIICLFFLPPTNKMVSSNIRNNCFNHTPPISTQHRHSFLAFWFPSVLNSLQHGETITRISALKVSITCSQAILHVSVLAQPTSRPARAQIHMFLSAVRACSAFTYMTARKSDALRQKWKPASTSLSPRFSLSQTVTLSHTRPCAVPGCLTGSYCSEI